MPNLPWMVILSVFALQFVPKQFATKMQVSAASIGRGNCPPHRACIMMVMCFRHCGMNFLWKVALIMRNSNSSVEEGTLQTSIEFFSSWQCHFLHFQPLPVLVDGKVSPVAHQKHGAPRVTPRKRGFYCKKIYLVTTTRMYFTL